MTKHTPGPWLATNSETTPGFWSVEALDADGQRESDICYVTLGGPSKAMGNARLIASAPELLEAHDANLAELWLLRRAIHEGDSDRELLIRVADMEGRTERAIAKATQP